MNLYRLHSNPKVLIGDYKLTPLLYRIEDSVHSDEESTEYDIVRTIVQMKLVGNDRIEKSILDLKMDGTLLMFLYATDALQDRWKAAEKFLKKDEWIWDDYDEEIFGA